MGYKENSTFSKKVILVSGIKHLAATISKDMGERLPKQRKTQRENLSLMVATMLEIRSANTNDLAAALPRSAERFDMRYQWLSRVLGNPHIHIQEVMMGYSKELLERLQEQGQTIIITLDQSTLGDTYEMLMVSVRVGERALPLLWSAHKTKGSIGFEHQEPLLRAIAQMLPKGVKIVFMADRFYGTSGLVSLCQELGWGYRIRLKGNLIFHHEGTEITSQDAYEVGLKALENARFHNTSVTTHIGIIHDDGHKEPWFIAMDCPPNEYKTLDYGLRWSIEAMFSDFKSRGFGIEDTQMRYKDRLERLILVMTLALYWATSTGMWHQKKHASPFEKKEPKGPLARSFPTLNAACVTFSIAPSALSNLLSYGCVS